MQKVVEVSQYELERGKPMPSRLHSRVQTNLLVQITNGYGEQYDLLSELSLELNDWESVPDIAIYPKTEFDYSADEVRVTTPPLCAIEILSPSQSLNELVSKAGSYFMHGVTSCWLVFPALKNIYVFSDPQNYQIFRADQTLNDPALGISLELSQIFK